MAATLSVAGAVVGEFVGADKGLGYLLLVTNSNMETALMFAASNVMHGLKNVGETTANYFVIAIGRDSVLQPV